MRVEADPARCQAYEICVAVAPSVFAIADGAVEVLDSHPGDDLREVVQEAVSSCPVEAIWTEER